MNYHQVFTDAVQALSSEYERGLLTLHAEADLQSYLFLHCVLLMRQRGFGQPSKIHANYSVLSPREKIDLVLGNNEVLVELKFEPNWANLPTSRRPVVSKEDIEKDIARMRRHANGGFQNCYVLILDEQGVHRKAFPALEWITLSCGRKRAYLLCAQPE